MTLANDLSVQETRRVGKDILICGKKYTCLKFYFTFVHLYKIKFSQILNVFSLLQLSYFALVQSI